MENAIAGSAPGALIEQERSTAPWAVAWLTWPALFVGNLGTGLYAIAKQWDYSMVLTSLLFANAAVLIALETAFPAERRWKMSWRSFLRDLKYFGVSGMTIAATNALFGLASIRLNAGHAGPTSDWPLWLSVPVTLLVVDFFNYWQHRWSHELKGRLGEFLWRTHVAHHLPQQVYVLIANLIVTLQGLVSHLNLDLRAGWFNYLFVGTELHRYHHSARLDESKNYAATLSILDLAFGTFYYRPGRLPERLGVQDLGAYPDSNELWRVIKLPFVSRA